MKRLLLISNSTNHGSTYLDHCMSTIKQFLDGINHVLFIPYASNDWEGYIAAVKKRFKQEGITAESIHTAPDQVQAVQRAQAIFIGGGNTFRLLNKLYETSILTAIREKVETGLPYIGASAGVNVACPTIKTTNDMPIIEPPSFDALNLVPFQINPHFIDGKNTPTHMGETREDRINEFLDENSAPVVGLKEGAWLRVENKEVFLEGSSGVKLFRKGKPPKEFLAPRVLNFLV